LPASSCLLLLLLNGLLQLLVLRLTHALLL
jgi:hypothetical protein